MTMRQNRMMAVLAALVLPNAASAADWPQWHGPNRDNMSTESGLLKAWPDGGPKLLWVAEGLGKGFSTVSVALESDEFSVTLPPPSCRFPW